VHSPRDSEYRALALPISNHTSKAPLMAKMRCIFLAMESHGTGIGSPSQALFLLLPSRPSLSLLALYHMDVNFHRPRAKIPCRKGHASELYWICNLSQEKPRGGERGAR